MRDFGIEVASILRNHFGDGLSVSAPNRVQYARETLGITFRPAAESIIDHFRQLLDDGLISRASRNSGDARLRSR